MHACANVFQSELPAVLWCRGKTSLPLFIIMLIPQQTQNKDL